MQPNGPKHPDNHRLTPQGQPRYVRCYDNDGETIDRFTVIFNGPQIRKKCGGQVLCLAMSENPYHPQGVSLHEIYNTFIDAPQGWTTSIGRKNHLGIRPRFVDLPTDCRKIVWQNYTKIWGGVKAPATV